MSPIIILSGDIEMNPGLKSNLFSNQGLIICHCNLSSMLVHMYTKVSFLPAYISIHKFDIIYLSETYLKVAEMSAIWRTSL